MKIRVSMKTPDALHEAIKEAIDRSGVAKNDYDMCQLIEDRIIKIAKRWFSYNESVELEIDTEAETCTVLSNRL